MKRLNALFLLSLFLLVIAFPGYGRSAQSGSGRSTVQSSETSTSLERLLKRCLQIGINLIEEERCNEEGGDSSSSSAVCFMLSEQVTDLALNRCTLHYFIDHPFNLQNITLIGNYPPPDCN